MKLVLKNELLHLIESKRLELCHIVEKYGFHSTESIQHSQELDHLLNLYQRTFSNYHKAQ